jgi:DNA-binding NarL/FixJ family response regulator
MAVRTLVAYLSSNRLIGEALASALRMVEADVVAEEWSTLSSRPDLICPHAVLLLIAPNGLPEIQGLIRSWRSRHDAPVIAVIRKSAETDVSSLLCAGASACISMNESLEFLMAKLEMIRSFSRTSSASRTCARVATISPLTAREREILILLIGGFSNKQIAHRLLISVSTTKNHVHNILGKLGISRRHDALMRAQFSIGDSTEGGPPGLADLGADLASR